MLIGFCMGRLRADKGGDLTEKGSQTYCFQNGVSLEFASTNTPRQIVMFDRVGRTLAAVVRCILADSGLPMILWVELITTAAFLGNGAPHSAIRMQSPCKLLHGTEIHRCQDLRSHRDAPPSEPYAASSVEQRHGCPLLHHRRRLSAGSSRLHFVVGTRYQCFCELHHRWRALCELTGGRTFGSDQRHHHPEGHNGRRSRRLTARGVHVQGSVDGGRPGRRYCTWWSIGRGSSAGGQSGAAIITAGASLESSPAVTLASAAAKSFLQHKANSGLTRATMEVALFDYFSE